MSYEYIQRAYGKTFETGMRVHFTECGGRYGVVQKPSSQAHYVNVKFDDGTEGNCHPGSLEIEATEATQ